MISFWVFFNSDFFDVGECVLLSVMMISGSLYLFGFESC